MTERTLAAYYDWLSRYVAALRRLRGDDRLTMRRVLAGPNGGPAHDADDEILAAIALPPAPRVLDAGCGLGGTILRWHRQLGGRYVGLTLSAVQRDAAEREAVRRGADGDCRFELCSYDAPPPGPFDAVVAVESLVHSPDLARTVGALARRLAPGGWFAVVDDMPEPVARLRAPAELERFTRGWQCPDAWPEAAYRAAFAAAGLEVAVARDLTALVPRRGERALRRREAAIAFARALLPFAAARTVLGALDGGLALERLNASGCVRYRLLAARAR